MPTTALVMHEDCALHDTGWHHSSPSLREDGLHVGYLETPDLAAAQQGMADTEVNTRWQREMAAFFEVGRPDEGLFRLAEVFHLD